MSNKKFFSLISGAEVHVAPNSKVIPAQEFSQMQEALEILDKTKVEVDEYRLKIAKECEELKEQALKEGFQEGFQQWAEHIAKLETEITNVRSEMEKVVGKAALMAAKKIVGREIELSQDTVADIVTNSLKSVSQHKKITIYVNPKDLTIVEVHRNKLKEIFESLETLSLRGRDDIKPGGCIIETEGGIINAQLENQWQALENAFTSLMMKKK